MDEKRVPSAYARMLYAADRSADAANVFKSIVAHAKDRKLPTLILLEKVIHRHAINFLFVNSSKISS